MGKKSKIIKLRNSNKKEPSSNQHIADNLLLSLQDIDDQLNRFFEKDNLRKNTLREPFKYNTKSINHKLS